MLLAQENSVFIIVGRIGGGLIPAKHGTGDHSGFLSLGNAVGVIQCIDTFSGSNCFGILSGGRVASLTLTNDDKFLGWEGEQYDTMPAKDITYRASIESGIFGIYGDISKMNVYDLEGRKIDNPERLKSGVYIINGKRVLLK